MKTVNQTVEIVTHVPPDKILAHLERCARICYQSDTGEAEKLVRRLIRDGHESTIEHISITAIIVTDRGVTHEMVRHRLASYSQESSRYCNYSKCKFGGEISVICPPGLDDPDAYAVWDDAMRHAEAAYMRLLRDGVPPEIARSVLPTALKTQIAMTCNLREWRHFIKLRALGHHGKPHPQIKEIALMILEQLHEAVPVVFDDLWEEAHECTPRN